MYQMQTRWVSELDVFIVSRHVLNIVTELCINISLSTPSDDSPISLIVNSDDLKSTPTGQLLYHAN